MKDDRLTERVIKYAFIFLGSIGTILFIRLIVRPMLPLTATHPVNFAIGLLAFGLIVAAAASGVAIVLCLLRAFGGRSNGK